MAKPPFYARICWSKPEDWFEKQDPVYFAKEFFNLEDTGQSSYEVWNEYEEARAVAAHMLAFKPPKLANCYIIRFCELDTTRAGVRVATETLGHTGIVAIDHRHRDLVGSKKQLRELMASALERLRSGEDVLRLIKKSQLHYQLAHFISLPIWDRPTHAAGWCEVLLKTKKDEEVCRDQAKANVELADARIPEEALRPRAKLLWERNGQIDGDDLADWYAAQTELRMEYQAHYMKHCFRPS